MSAKMKKAAQKPGHNEAKAATPAQPLQFLGTAIRELTYRELPVPSNMTVAELQTSGALRDQSIVLQSQIGFAPPNLVEVSIHATMTPVGDVKAFDLSLKLSGLFAKTAEMSNREAAEALSEIAGRMLFPFIREALMTMTSKTILGLIPVQPIFLGPLFTDAQFAEIKD